MQEKMHNKHKLKMEEKTMMLQKMTALILSMLILAACTPVPEATPPVDTGPDISMQKDEYSLVTLTWFLCSFEDALGAGLGKASGDDPVMEAIRQETGVTLQMLYCCQQPPFRSCP